MATNNESWAIAQGGVANLIAGVFEDVRGGEDVARANARLIAAAPELLAALKFFTDRHVAMVNSGDCGDWNPEHDAEVIAARAAIAKAEGR